MKILVLDIETRPSLGYVWQLWDQNISLSQLVEVGEVICFAAKWLDGKKIIFKSTYHHSKEEMVQKAWDLIDEADAVIHYNGKGFDIKHLNREFLLAGLTPPSPHKDIDLLTVCRGRFKFLSNKLDHVANQLGLGNKISHAGFQLWIDCMAGNKKAWGEMRNYNMHDVVLTEQLYYKLLPWIKNHPNVNLYNGDDNKFACRCGSVNLHKRGYQYTGAGRYQQYQCNDCGAYNADRKRNLSAALKNSN